MNFKVTDLIQLTFAGVRHSFGHNFKNGRCPVLRFSRLRKFGIELYDSEKETMEEIARLDGDQVIKNLTGLDAELDFSKPRTEGLTVAHTVVCLLELAQYVTHLSISDGYEYLVIKEDGSGVVTCQVNGYRISTGWGNNAQHMITSIDTPVLRFSNWEELNTLFGTAVLFAYKRRGYYSFSASYRGQLYRDHLVRELFRRQPQSFIGYRDNCEECENDTHNHDL